MRRASGFSTGVLALSVALTQSACNERASAPSPPPTLVAPKPPSPGGLASIAPRIPDSPASAGSLDALTLSPMPGDESAAPASSTQGPKAQSKLTIDEPISIGPAGPMSADEHGVVLIDRNDELRLAKRGAPGSNERPERARFSRILGGASDFFAVARGPFLLRGKAYWVTDGKLVRRALDSSSPLEVLARDARNGTRVVGADAPGVPAHALYVARPKADDASARAKLWVEGAETDDLSPEGAGASSVAVASIGEDLFTIAIDARSAMTPLHGRRVHFNAGKPELGPDVVMWVGASSQTLSEVFATTTSFGVRAFLPIERDISHFGLVMLDLGSEPHMDPKTIWRGYPNGIDVAPVASAAFCSAAFVAYVRPADSAPGASQVLELAEISEAGLGPPEVVAAARGFSNLSLGAGANSAVLAYVADYQTFATTLRCKHKK